MIKYFISHSTLEKIRDSKLDINIDELKLLMNTKDDEYKIIDYTNLIENNDISSFIKKIESSRPNLKFMYELEKSDAKKIHPIYIRRFDYFDNCDMLFKDNYNKVKLLDYEIISSMTYEEISKCKNLYLIPNEDGTFRLSTNKEELKDDKKYKIGKGTYLYTEDEELLKKYKDRITIVERKDIDKYVLTKTKLVIMDSVGQDRLSDLGNDGYRFLYEIYYTSEPVYITENDNSYEIKTIRESNTKKGYLILNRNINNLLLDSAIEPFIKYINIYELVDGKYKLTKASDIIYTNKLKYTKKPRNS